MAGGRGHANAEKSTVDPNLGLRKIIVLDSVCRYGSRGIGKHHPSCVKLGIGKRFPNTQRVGFKDEQNTLDACTVDIVGAPKGI